MRGLALRVTAQGEGRGGGSGARFAQLTWWVVQGKVGGEAAALAPLALLGLLSLAMAGCGVLGVVHWREMSGRQWWRVGRAMAFSHCWHWHAGVRRGGT